MAYTDRYANFDLATGDNDGSSEANAWRTPAAVIAAVAAGDRVNIKQQSSPYDLTATINFNVAGTATAPIWYRGYLSTIGDGGKWAVAYNTAGTANLDFSAAFLIVEDISFSPGASSNINAFYVDGLWSIAIRCYAHNRTDSSINISNALFCDYEFTNNSRIRTAGTNSASYMIYGCRFKQNGASTNDNTLYSDTFGMAVSVVNCVFIGSGTAGDDAIFLDRVSDCRGIYLTGNRFYNFDNGIVIDEEPNSTFEQVYITRNVFSTMAAYAIERTNAEAGYVHLFNNWYHACTSGFTNYSAEAERWGNAALTASPFTLAGSDDLSLNDTASAGAVLRTAGFPIQEPYDWDNWAFEATYEGAGGSSVYRRLAKIIGG